MVIVEEDAALSETLQEGHSRQRAPSTAMGQEGSLPERALQLQARSGRRSKFKAEDDVILLREVAAHKEHIAKYVAMEKHFDLVATAVNSNTAFWMNNFTAKIVQDRYVPLQRQFDTTDRREQLMSGIGGEVGETDELLSMMKETLDDMATVNKKEKYAAKGREERKIEAGKTLMEAANARVAGPE